MNFLVALDFEFSNRWKYCIKEAAPEDGNKEQIPFSVDTRSAYHIWDAIYVIRKPEKGKV